MNKALILCTAMVIGSFLACSRGRDLRGSSKKSSDGKTYLIVGDDNGGGCPLKLDGKAWAYPKGERGNVVPGRHTLTACEDNSFVFEVEKGTVYTFDYWGP